MKNNKSMIIAFVIIISFKMKRSRTNIHLNIY